MTALERNLAKYKKRQMMSKEERETNVKIIFLKNIYC